MNSEVVPASQPRVSVVVPCYQQIDYIEQCLDGILLQQTDFEIEILLGDDGSTDGTREICIRYAKDHPLQIKLFLREQAQRHPGHPPGRDNLVHLLNTAKGQFIARCDGDDYWTDPFKLQQQVTLLHENPKAAGCFNLVQVMEEPSGTLGRIYGDHGARNIFQAEATISALALCHPSGFLYRHSVLSTLPAWLSLVGSADLAMFTLTADRGDLICLPKVMGVYRKHVGGVTMSPRHSGTRQHYNRILLWLFIDRHFNGRYAAKCQELFIFHWQLIIRNNAPRQRLRYLLDLIYAVPGWFLHNPMFSIHRLREAFNR